MNCANLRAAMHPHLLDVPISQLSLCPDCGEFYKNTFSFYCRESQGQETEEALCPTWECREARETRL